MFNVLKEVLFSLLHRLFSKNNWKNLESTKCHLVLDFAFRLTLLSVLDFAFRLTFFSCLDLLLKVIHSLSRMSCTWLILTLTLLQASLNEMNKSSNHMGSYIRACLCSSWFSRMKLSNWSWTSIVSEGSFGSSVTMIDSSGKSSEIVEVLLSWDSESSS